MSNLIKWNCQSFFNFQVDKKCESKHLVCVCVCCPENYTLKVNSTCLSVTKTIDLTRVHIIFDWFESVQISHTPFEINIITSSSFPSLLLLLLLFSSCHLLPSSFLLHLSVCRGRLSFHSNLFAVCPFHLIHSSNSSNSWNRIIQLCQQRLFAIINNLVKHKRSVPFYPLLHHHHHRCCPLRKHLFGLPFSINTLSLPFFLQNSSSSSSRSTQHHHHHHHQHGTSFTLAQTKFILIWSPLFFLLLFPVCSS